jgi:zinc/manganese transport system permease protein
MIHSLHEFFVAPFQYGFMRHGLLSALFLSISGGLLGCVLVLRRLALMGDALSHSLLPGIAVAWLLFGASTPALFAGALLAGLLTALGSALLSRLTRVKEDASFGSLFILFFGAGVALLSRVPTRLNLAHFLFGSILGVGPAELRISGAAGILTLLVFVLFYRSILLETFDPVFNRVIGGRGGLVHLGILGLTVLNLVAALQTMGIVLGLGLFLLPAVTAYLWCDRFGRMLALAVAIAMAGSGAGILLSYHAGLASGASIVMCLGAGFLGSALFSPSHGAIGRLAGWSRERTHAHRADRRD